MDHNAGIGMFIAALSEGIPETRRPAPADPLADQIAIRRIDLYRFSRREVAFDAVHADRQQAAIAVQESCERSPVNRDTTRRRDAESNP